MLALLEALPKDSRAFIRSVKPPNFFAAGAATASVVGCDGSAAVLVASLDAIMGGVDAGAAFAPDAATDAAAAALRATAGLPPMDLSSPDFSLDIQPPKVPLVPLAALSPSPPPSTSTALTLDRDATDCTRTGAMTGDGIVVDVPAAVVDDVLEGVSEAVVLAASAGTV